MSDPREAFSVSLAQIAVQGVRNGLVSGWFVSSDPRPSPTLEYPGGRDCGHRCILRAQDSVGWQ